MNLMSFIKALIDKEFLRSDSGYLRALYLEKHNIKSRDDSDSLSELSQV
jgi:hypothetical protein